ncbi:MAG: type II secretion system GspH family protein [Candidatus Omnitrophica bacterium]|nr:type II secretion system GspH family protein [Candidatus Omnitrophota bacterium]
MLKNNNAYTLAELLVSLAIFSVVIGSLMTILISQNAFFSRASASVEVGANARKVMSLMVKELRLSKVDRVEVYDKNGNKYDKDTHPDGADIYFKVPIDCDNDGDRFDVNGNIEWGCEGGLEWFIEYYFDEANKRVMRRLLDASKIAQSETVIANNISGFLIQGFHYNFTNKIYEPDSACNVLRITITSERDSISGRILDTPLTYTLTNQVSWRN